MIDKKDEVLAQLILNSHFGKKRKCMKCNKARNHAGQSTNVFYCNDCKPAKYK